MEAIIGREVIGCCHCASGKYGHRASAPKSERLGLWVSNVFVFISMHMCVCVSLCCTQQRSKRGLKKPPGARGVILGPSWPLLWLGPSCEVLGICQLEDRSVPMQLHTQTNMCPLLTHTDHLQWSICLFAWRGHILFECDRGQLWSEENLLAASLWRRKIKSNKILCFPPNNKPSSHTQQSLTPMAHTIAKAITSWIKKSDYIKDSPIM